MNLEIVMDNLEKAASPEDVFGISIDKEFSIKSTYKYLAAIVHEDKYVGKDKELAHEAFILLGSWYEQALYKVTNGTYGNKAASAVPKPKFDPITLMVAGKELVIQEVLCQGAFSTVYKGLYKDPLFADNNVHIKVVRNVRDNDLLEQESKVLSKFGLPSDDAIQEKFFKMQRNYVPKLVVSFFFKDSSSKKLRANILYTPTPKEKCYTIKELVENKFPSGIEPKHCYWIYRRLLLTLWMAQLQGVVHGAVTPEHILVYPKEHGIILLDWTCSVKSGRVVKALNPLDKEFYAPEILAKRPVNSSTDLFMASKVLIYMLQKQRIPAGISIALDNCLNLDRNKRPQKIGPFYEEFGTLLGKKEFAEFVVK